MPLDHAGGLAMQGPAFLLVLRVDEGGKQTETQHEKV
jgi:hypothetical protein